MDDLISRKTAIEAFDGAKVDEGNCIQYDIGYNDGIDFAISTLSVLPSAQPERKRGKWIEMLSYMGHIYKCSECGRLINVTDGKNNVSKRYPYCHCGADMRGEDNE